MQVLADAKQMQAMVRRLSREIDARRNGGEPWAVVGIRSRGDILAQRIAKLLKIELTGSVDITLYRDDLSEVGPQPVVRTTEIDFDVDGVNILLVDDVIMSGRSARAALQSLVDFGRPRCVRLAVLVDRGERERPLAADYVGMTVTATDNQLVEVRLTPTDPDDEIVLFDRPRTQAESSK